MSGMYTPKFNRITERGMLLEAMQAYAFAIVFGPVAASATDAATPVATHLPLVVKDEGEHGLIQGHFARANSHWQALSGRGTLVVFPGPHSYVSPTLYTETLSVPTWNYITVHAYGTVELIEDAEGKNRLVEELIGVHDPGYLEKWRGMPEGFRRTMLSGIMGFQMLVARIEGKFKISQNRAPEERRNVQAAHARGSADEQDLARWMARLTG
ncbi:MAG TPA: FMN-binding negative transcriptional regulator [Terracidiphilus sp.]|jgi:transcriptional regulator